MKTKLLSFIFYLIFLPSCYAARMDGPYEGRVIDADTGQPIEGVVVLGTWDRETPTPGGAVHSFYDAQETLTNRNGDFVIKGIGLLVLNNIVPPNITVFKVGYSYDNLLWIAGELSLYSRIKWEGKKAIIPLKKLTMEERKKQGIPDIYIEQKVIEKTKRGLPVTGLFIPNKLKMMLKEINKELMEQGRKPLEGE